MIKKLHSCDKCAFLLAGEGFSQCYSDTACSGSLVPAANQRECCAGTDEGLAYNDGGTCSVCIGMSEVDFVINKGIMCSSWVC